MQDWQLVLKDVERLYGFFPKVQYLGFNNQDMPGKLPGVRHTWNFALIFDEGLDTASYLMDGRRFDCSTPAMVYVEPSVHSYCQVNAGPCRKLYICYPESENFFDGRCGRTGLPVLSPVVLTDSVRKLACEIITLAQGWHCVGMADRIDCLCANFVMELLLARSVDSKNNHADDLLHKMSDYIRSHCMDGLDFQELSRRLGMSQRSFIRKWKEQYGISPKQFQMQCRMEVARNYLRDSDLSVHEIAGMLGFCDQFAFARIFRKNSGLSPTEWRKSSSFC